MIRLENNGVAGAYTSSGTGTTIEFGMGTGEGGPNSQQGPEGGEFYWSDNFSTGHSETVFGGLALHLPSNRLAVSNMNPIDGRTDAGGMRIYNTDNGSTLQNYEVYKRDYGKAAGVGDMELLCAETLPPTHSIGNRVWLDSNNNGLADVGESAVPANVKLDLKDTGGTVLQSTQTDADGHYLFHGLAAGSYQVCLTADNFTSGGVLDKHRSSTGFTDANTTSVDGDDSGDDDASDGVCATLVALDATEPASETTATGNDGNDGHGTPDANSNLTVDFGVVPPVDLKLTKVVDKASANRGDILVYTLTLSNETEVAATGVKVVDNLPSGVTLVEATPSQGSFTVGEWTVGTVAANASVTLIIKVTVN